MFYPITHVEGAVVMIVGVVAGKYPGDYFMQRPGSIRTAACPKPVLFHQPHSLHLLLS